MMRVGSSSGMCMITLDLMDFVLEAVCFTLANK
jgi:hypothetical protein